MFRKDGHLKVIAELNFEWDVSQSVLVKKGHRSLGPDNSKVIAFFTSQVRAAALPPYYLSVPAAGGRAFIVADKLKWGLNPPLLTS